MKINISEENKTTLSKRDKDFIKMFESDKDFEKLIEHARYNIGLTNLLNSFSSPEIVKDSENEAQKIVDLYNLPNSWIWSLQFFIVTGKFMSFGENIYLSGDSLRYSNAKENYLHEPLTISITQKVSFRDFYNWIMIHKNEIKKRLLTLPPRRKPPKLLKYKSLIYEMNQKGYTSSQIENELINKYPRLLNKSAFETKNIQRWIREYKKILKGAPLKSKKK